LIILLIGAKGTATPAPEKQGSAMRRRSGKPSNSNENQLYLLGELYNLIVEYTTVGTVKNKHEIL